MRNSRLSNWTIAWLMLLQPAFHLTASSRSVADERAADWVYPNPVELDFPTATAESDENPYRLTQESQPLPLDPVPEPLSLMEAYPGAAGQLSVGMFGATGLEQSLLTQARRSESEALTADVVLGAESLFRASTDAANLLGKSNSARGVIAQRRAPLITDPRVRGSQIGQLTASGSYWFPARPDVDTLLSKIDSRIIDNMIVVKGPYAARYGPGFNFIDVQLLAAPRYEDGFSSYGNSSIEYKTNGEQVYGRQTFWGGGENYGFRAGYGHRTGNDYTSGNGQQFFSSYNSRDFDFAAGYDPTPDRHIDFSYLRLDQTGVELPNQFLDIAVLKTDGYELQYVMEDSAHFDVLTAEGWFNATRIQSDANSPGKAAQVPFIPATNLSVASDAVNSSAGFTTAGTWGDPDCVATTVGLDFRYLRQQINQFFPGDTLFSPPPGLPFNQPLPKAYSSNPGLFLEHTRSIDDARTVKAGARFDLVDTNAANDAPLVASTGFPPLDPPPNITTDLETALGGGQFNRSFTLGSGYLTASQELDSCWTATGGAAYAMRAPTMAELYSVGPLVTTFAQRTVTSLVGNPRLASEKRYQVDLGLHSNFDGMRFGIDGYYAWLPDYITYDVVIPQSALMAFTNTDLATLAGFELYGRVPVTDVVTAFGEMYYVEGRDHTRNVNAIPASRYRPAGSPRSGSGTTAEPLPMILPLETRFGILLQQPVEDPRWGGELSVRMVANQGRIATSLAELPTEAFTTLDLRGYWRATDLLTFYSGIENLTDANYQEHLDAHAQNFNTPIPANFGGGLFPLPGNLNVFQPGINFYLTAELNY